MRIRSRSSLAGDPICPPVDPTAAPLRFIVFIARQFDATV
jgi:hypothetical protein